MICEQDFFFKTSQYNWLLNFSDVVLYKSFNVVDARLNYHNWLLNISCVLLFFFNCTFALLILTDLHIINQHAEDKFGFD